MSQIEQKRIDAYNSSYGIDGLDLEDLLEQEGTAEQIKQIHTELTENIDKII